MSLDRLVEEVRVRSRSDVEAEKARAGEAVRKIMAERDAELKRIAEEGARSVALETARIRARELAKARVEGRKLVFAARRRAADRAIADARERLQGYTASKEYADLLEQLYEHAVARLGKSVRLIGRAEDAAILKSLQGKGPAPGTAPILGGLIAESADKSRRLDLSFDELLRRREDELLALARPVGTGG
jgi:vacuolar-type H+-ATPase subunit E/Vma4